MGRHLRVDVANPREQCGTHVLHEARVIAGPLVARVEAHPSVNCGVVCRSFPVHTWRLSTVGVRKCSGEREMSPFLYGFGYVGYAAVVTLTAANKKRILTPVTLQ